MSEPRDDLGNATPDAPAAGTQSIVRTDTDSQPKTRQLPPYKVLLHNDEVNQVSYVVRTIMELIRLGRQEAIQRTWEAEQRGVACLLVTHKERAELYAEQFTSKGLTVTIEPA